MRNSIAAILCIVVVVAACSGGAEEGSDVDSACRAYAEEMCRMETKCSPITFDFDWGDQATCREAELRQCQRRAAAPGTGVTPALLTTCAQGLAPLSCGATWPPACEIPAGKLPNDSPCFFASQCAGRRCAGVSGSPCGRCQTRVKEGGGCGASLDCLAPLVCLEGQCRPPPVRGEGEACGGTSPDVCRYPLLCQGQRLGPTGTLPGKCAPPLTQGATCPDPSENLGEACDLEKGLICDGQTSTCQPHVSFPRPGEPCVGDLCNGAGFCDGRTCQRRAREGERCEVIGCLAPADCVEIAGTGTMECRVVTADVCK